MKRLAVAVLLAGTAWTGTAHAAGDEVQRGPVPQWAPQSDLLAVPEDAGGLMFVRRQDYLVHLDATGEQHHMSYRIRLLHPNALQMGNLSIAWNPASGAPTVHAIRIHRGSQVIDALADGKFEVLRREDQLEQARLDGILTAVMQVPDLRVGDELEVSLTRPTADPTMGQLSSGLLMLMTEPPPGRFRLGLSWEEGQEPSIKMGPPMEKAALRQDRRIEWRFDNPPLAVPAKDAPLRFALTRMVEFSDFGDWADVSRHFAPLYDKAAQRAAGSPLKAEAARIAAAHATPRERASAALKLVQQQVRYIYVGLNGGNLQPATAEETWQRRYGDCKGKTALLLALLAELGIEAQPVLVSNGGADDGLDARLPISQMFDHVMVRARIDGQWLWLDGTLPPVVPPGDRPFLPYRWVLPLTEAGTALEEVPWQPFAVPQEMSLYEIDATAGFDVPARITNTIITRGVDALEQHAQFSALTQAQLLNGLRQQMVGDVWQEIEAVKWRFDEKAGASVLTISGKGMADWDDDGDGDRSMSLPGGGFSPPERRVRAAEQDATPPYRNTPGFDCHVTTVRLPAGTQPRQWSFNTSYSTRLFGRSYRRAFEMRDGTVRMLRSSRVEELEISPELAAADNQRIATFDNSMAWLRFDRMGERAGSRSVAKVPATYEIDWASAPVPCLAPDPDAK